MDVVSFFTRHLLSVAKQLPQETDADWSTLPLDVVINVARHCGRREIQACRLINKNWCAGANFAVSTLHITPDLISFYTDSLDSALAKVASTFKDIQRVAVDAKLAFPFKVFVRHFSNVASLDLFGMRIRDAEDFEYIEQLGELKHLNLGRSNINGTTAISLVQCSLLETLDLWRTNVRYEDIHHVLPLLPNLTNLNLGYTKLTDRDMDFFNALPQLQFLDMGNTSIGSRSLQSLSGLVKLKSLFLDYTKVDDAGTQYLTSLTNLVDLNLGNTSISDAGLSNLTWLTNLMDLKLGHTTVSDVGLIHFSGLSNLMYVYLDGTNVRDAGVNYLTTIMPHLHVQIRLDTSGIQF